MKGCWTLHFFMRAAYFISSCGGSRSSFLHGAAAALHSFMGRQPRFISSWRGGSSGEAGVLSDKEGDLYTRKLLHGRRDRVIMRMRRGGRAPRRVTERSPRRARSGEEGGRGPGALARLVSRRGHGGRFRTISGYSAAG